MGNRLRCMIQRPKTGDVLLGDGRLPRQRSPLIARSRLPKLASTIIRQSPRVRVVTSGILWESWSGIVGFGKRLLLGQRPERSRCLCLIQHRLCLEGTGETKAWPACTSRFQVLKSLAQVLVQGTNEPSRSHDDRESDPTRPQLQIRPDFWLPA